MTSVFGFWRIKWRGYPRSTCDRTRTGETSLLRQVWKRCLYKWANCLVDVCLRDISETMLSGVVLIAHRRYSLASFSVWQMESEKEELSQELISAKLQVAQLSMEVDGLKLRHRQEAIAASEAHAQALESALSPPQSVVSMASQTSPVSPRSVSSPVGSPVSPHTMEL